MTPSDEEFAGRLKAYLDQAAGDLRPGLAYRLQAARNQALERLAENPQSEGNGRLVGAHGLVGAGAGGGTFKAHDERPLLTQGRLWLAIGVLALAVLGWQQWTAWQELSEVEDLDAQILTSDLPIDALVDRGFLLFLEIAPTLVPDEPPAIPEAPVEDAQAIQTSHAPAEAPTATKPAE